ncbi:MAG: APC family permease [Planctomycetota bacterium]|jgi:amino acid transporter
MSDRTAAAAEPPAAGSDAELRRVLGPIDATCVVIGAIIGVGIFFTPSRVAVLAESGSVALLAWAVGAVIALLGALTFAELGALYPHSGGQYRVLRDAYGSFPAFLFVFCNATAIQAGAGAIIGIICAQNLGVAVAGAVPDTVSMLTLSALLIAGLAVANVLGVRWGAGIQNVTVFAKVLVLLAVTLLAAALGDASPDATPAPVARSPMHLGLVGIVFAALVPAFFSFGGWQQALWMAGEVRRPHRNVPLAIVVGVVVVAGVYLLANWAYFRLLGFDGVAGSRALAADAVAAVWPGPGPRVIAAAVAVSAFGVLNAQMLAGPRLVYGMATDGRFFAAFARVSTRFGTPWPAIALIAIMALVLLLAAGERGVDRLLTGVVFIDCVFFALTGLALVVLRRRRPDAERPVRIVLVVPVLFVLGEIGILAGAYADPAMRAPALIGMAWILAAAACYLLFFRGSGAGRDIGHRP